MGRPNKFTVKHFLNKRLSTKYNDEFGEAFPLYLRLRFAGRGLEYKSFIASISYFLELGIGMNDFIRENEINNYCEFSDKGLELTSDYRKKLLKTELELVLQIFDFYNLSGVNILKEETQYILGTHINPLFNILDGHIVEILSWQIEKESNNEYKEVAKHLFNAKIGFSALFTTLKKISCDEKVSTNFYHQILKPCEPYYHLLSIIYYDFTQENYTTLFNYPQNKLKIKNTLLVSLSEIEVNKCLELIEETREFYFKDIPGSGYN